MATALSKIACNSTRDARGKGIIIEVEGKGAAGHGRRAHKPVRHHSEPTMTLSG